MMKEKIYVYPFKNDIAILYFLNKSINVLENTNYAFCGSISFKSSILLLMKLILMGIKIFIT